MIDANINKQLIKAKNTVFHLFKTRNRSEQEVRDRLNIKRFNKEIIEQTVSFALKAGLINDQKFAEDWINIRLTKPFGVRRIFFELQNKGINESLIKKSLEKQTLNYSEENTVFDLAEKQLAKYSHIDNKKRKQRLLGYLSRRGFSQEVINNTIKKIIKNDNN